MERSRTKWLYGVLLCFILAGVAVLGVLSLQLNGEVASVELAATERLQDMNNTLDRVEMAICQKYRGWAEKDSTVKPPEWCPK